jgi:mycothiol synthase
MAQYRITPIDIRAASEAEYRALYAFVISADLEYDPDEPPRLYKEVLNNWLSMPPMHRAYRWLAWEGEKVVAQLRTGYNSEATDNLHVLDFFLYVLPQHRRRGLAKQLLGHLLELSQQSGRPTLLSWSEEHIPAGQAFMTRLGAEKAMKTSFY